MTLDDQTRELDAEDLLITDDSGPIGIAGVMGGASTEISESTTDVVIEAAHFHPIVIARSSRRHKLSSEASRRFEREVDPELPRYAAQRVADLLAELAGGTIEPDETVVDTHALPTPRHHPRRSRRPRRRRTDHAGGNNPAPPVSRLPRCPRQRRSGGGADRCTPRSRRRRRDLSCNEAAGAVLTLTPPSWRPDLRDPNDFAEEVIRLFGFDNVPSVLPKAPGGQGLTVAQKRRRRIATALVGAGLTEVVSYPFVGDADFDAMGLPADDARRTTVKLANPLSDEEPSMQTMLLPTLLRTAERNAGRGATDLAIFQTGLVFLPRAEPSPRRCRTSRSGRAMTRSRLCTTPSRLSRFTSESC